MQAQQHSNQVRGISHAGISPTRMRLFSPSRVSSSTTDSSYSPIIKSPTIAPKHLPPLPLSPNSKPTLKPQHVKKRLRQGFHSPMNLKHSKGLGISSDDLTKSRMDRLRKHMSPHRPDRQPLEFSDSIAKLNESTGAVKKKQVPTKLQNWSTQTGNKFRSKQVQVIKRGKGADVPKRKGLKVSSIVGSQTLGLDDELEARDLNKYRRYDAKIKDQVVKNGWTLFTKPIDFKQDLYRQVLSKNQQKLISSGCGVKIHIKH